MLIVLVLPVLIRKRSVTLMRILDAIQIVAYYKYFNGYIEARENFLYLGMRGWGNWAEGWGILTLDNDAKIPVWMNEETSINKIIRIFAIWLGIMFFIVLLAVVKTMTGDSQITLTNFIHKNWFLAMSIGFYINVQDMSFVMATSFNSMYVSAQLSSTPVIITFSASIVFGLAILILSMWMFAIGNYPYQEELSGTPQKIYPHIYIFQHALDYDLFPTYQLTALPEREKKINRYSNVRIIEIFKKVAFAFLMVSFLYDKDYADLQHQIFSVIGFLLFFDLLWYVSMPYDTKS